MTKLLALTSVVFLSAVSVAKATVPYSEIEHLRRQSIVVRVALDKPQSPVVKACKIKIDFATLGAKLSLLQDNFAKPWEKVTLSTEDLANLDSKAHACMLRASCQAYATFVGAAKAKPEIQSEVTLLKEALEKKVTTMTAVTYSKAWKTVPQPCAILKQALKD